MVLLINQDAGHRHPCFTHEKMSAAPSSRPGAPVRRRLHRGARHPADERRLVCRQAPERELVSASGA